MWRLEAIESRSWLPVDKIFKMNEEIPGFDYAQACGKDVYPEKYLQLFHGTADVSPLVCAQQAGLPRKGDNIELLKHIEPLPGEQNDSAFRGTMQFPMSPACDASPAFWAGEGGWVFEIHDFPGYDVGQLLDGKIDDGKGGFRGPRMKEQEVAIPARVPRVYIKRIGVVVEGRRGPVVNWSA